ncbi:glycoside hydrolase [Membranicola marinus]|uniref:Glycoside hydrolase n=1 Tax=Membranihabitans marinus TaxID=1227546 RepID=A0A953L7T0_9BACT|nr:sialidase family protein [Membranihabitans marinus]MBY5956940.1 glycoside hydrolase [Membranihabitans marinus]
MNNLQAIFENIILFCALILCFSISVATLDAQSSGPVVTLQLNPGDNNPRNSEGDFVTLKDGSILFIYSHFVGDAPSDFGNSHLASRRSYDNGNTWTDLDEIVVENEGAMNVMSVCLLRLQNGQIALFYARKNSIHDCIPYMRISEDEGLTWSDPVKCITDRPGYFVLNNSRVIQLENGRLLMPVALHESEEVKGGALELQFNNYGKLFCYYSDNNGLTWKRKGRIDVPQGVMAQEPGLIELKDGRVMMYIRTNSGVQYASYSKNKGKKWSEAIPTNIPSPLSPATIVRIPATQDLLLVWNNNGVKKSAYGGKRTPLNLAVSKDEGTTWDLIKTIHSDPDGWYCYTAVHLLNDKEFLLSYCAGNRPAGTGLSITNITKVNLDWVYK